MKQQILAMVKDLRGDEIEEAFFDGDEFEEF